MNVGIDGAAVIADLKVQVRPGGIAGGARATQELSLSNFLPRLDGELVQVGVIGAPSIGVIDDDQIAIATAPFGKGDGAIGDGKIFVSTLDEAIRIRTGERGKDAI